VLNILRWLAVVSALFAIVGCSAVASISGTPASLDHVTLAADRQSVEVVVVGGPPLSEGKPCGTNYALASSAVNGTTLEVMVKLTAERTGACVLIDLVCCEHRFTVPLPDGQPVDRVRDMGASFERDFFLAPPTGLYQLHGMPAGWELRREWADWGGTWTRLYSPLADPQPGSTGTLLFMTTFGGRIVTEPEALQSPVIVNGVEAQYQRYPGVDNQIQLQWLVDGQRLTLETFEDDFSIDELIVLANSARPD
jgi:hypothetical protein